MTTIDIHLMFDNFGFKCTLNDSFCVKYVFDAAGQVGPLYTTVQYVFDELGQAVRLYTTDILVFIYFLTRSQFSL